MAFYSGATTIGTAPVPFVDPGIRGAMIQNAGTIALYFGSPNVAVGTGVSLAVGSPPIWVYGAPVVGELNTDFLHAVCAGTNGLVAWFLPV